MRPESRRASARAGKHALGSCTGSAAVEHKDPSAAAAEAVRRTALPVHRTRSVRSVGTLLLRDHIVRHHHRTAADRAATPRRASRESLRADPWRVRRRVRSVAVPDRCARGKSPRDHRLGQLSSFHERVTRERRGEKDARNVDMHRVVALATRIRLDVPRPLALDLDARARLLLNVLDKHALRARARGSEGQSKLNPSLATLAAASLDFQTRTQKRVA